MESLFIWSCVGILYLSFECPSSLPRDNKGYGREGNLYWFLESPFLRKGYLHYVAFNIVTAAYLSVYLNIKPAQKVFYEVWP